MAFADNPSFANKDKVSKDDLAQVTVTYICEPKSLRTYLDNILDDEDYVEVGRLIYCRQEVNLCLWFSAYP